MRTKSHPMNRALALILALCAMLSLLTVGASAATSTIEDGSRTAAMTLGPGHHYLKTTAGTTLGAWEYTYTTNDGLTGPAYCIDHGLHFTGKALPIDGKYSSSPKTAGVFANGYPQHSLDTFLGLYLEKNAILSGLTEDEYAYATQCAVWASLGQLAIDGTEFVSGREKIAQPTGDTQQMRVFRAIQLLLAVGNTWSLIPQTGMYIRTEEGETGGNISIPANMTLDFAAKNSQYGFKCEVIGGKSYYTHEYAFASATSTYYDNYCIELWADNAPSGYIFTDLSNAELAHGSFHEKSTWTLPTEGKSTTLNDNGFEYSGTAKLCIPVDTVPVSGEITINCGSHVMQYNIYLARNDDNTSQSYIIADPSKATVTANAALKWGGHITETGELEVLKVDGSNAPLSGAKFTLRGSDGSERTGVSGADGKVSWERLDPDITYTLVEDEAPAGFAIADPVNVTIHAATTSYVTVHDSVEKQFIVKKIDAQNGYSLAGAVIAFEQIDGSFYTTGTTDHAGIIQFNAEQLPIGSYKCYEVSAPEGYELSKEVQTVDWNGKHDVTLTFKDVRKPTLIIYKCDENNTRALSHAVFEVYKNGQLITTVETNQNGLAYVSGVSIGYYTIKEAVAPAGFEKSDEEYGAYVDVYDPAAADDPRVTVTNRALPTLRIVKLDRKTLKPIEGVTFEVWKDAVSLGKFRTSPSGEIFITGETGTYLVKELQTDDSHIVCSDPQQIRLTAGDATRELVFFNDKLPGAHLVKLDSSDLSTPIPNARFKFEAVDGSWGPQELTTGSDGTIDLSRLPAAALVVTELECPGYVVDDAQRIVELHENEDVEFVFTNSRLPALRLTKKSADGTALPGVSYRLARIEDGSRYLDRITSDTGEIVWTDLQPGVYSLQELSTDERHILDPKEYHVQLVPGRDSSIVLQNDVRPNLYIHKKDADTDEPVEGAVFLVKAADGHSLAEVKTNSQGVAVVENLLPQVVEVSEKSVPSPYLLDAPSQLVTLFANHDRDVYFENHKAPVVTIRKENSVTHDPIPNVRFHITWASNKSADGEIRDLGTLRTDEDGKIELQVEDGWLKIQELDCPGYQVKGSDTQEGFVKAGEAKTFLFENTPLSAIVIWKYDTVTGAPVEGATFAVKYLSGTTGTGGTVVDTVRTSRNGSATITSCKAGTYVIEELSSDSGHVIDTAPQTVYLSGEPQEVVTVSFGNSPKGSLLVKKVSAADGTPISDTEFLVTTNTGALVGTANGKFKTAHDGTFLVEGIDPGTVLVVKEVRAQQGFLLDDTAQIATIQAGKTVELEFRNQPLGNLIIRKLDGSDRKTPLEGVRFKITYADGSFVDADGGKRSSNGLYYTDKDGLITLSGITGTVVVTEEATIDGYTIGENSTQTVVVNPDDTQTLTFYNSPIGGVELIKVNENDRSQRIPNTTFEIRRLDGGLVSTVTTDKNGRVFASLEDGGYYAVETVAARNFKLDDTPIYFEVKGGKPTTLTVTNKALSGIVIHKIDATTGKGIYGVRFMAYDSKHNPIAEVVTDQNGYAAVEGLTDGGRYFLREMEAEGYIVDQQIKTVTVKAGETTEVTWKNTPITGQIQITKTSADYNSMNGWPEGTPIPNTVFEVYNRAGKLVDTIKTDKNGVAATKPLPLGRYKLVESKAADFYALDKTPIEVEIEFAGQIVKAAMTNKSLYTNVSITKRGYVEVMPGQVIRYDFSNIANNSTTALESFYWRDTLPTNAVRLDKIVTGTWNASGNYKIVYKTNYSGDYRVLADSLATSKNYVLNASPAALGLGSGEYVTEFVAVFGVVPVNFRQVEAPQVYCKVLDSLVGGTEFVNTADVGGLYNGQWIMAADRWVTRVYKPAKPLPRTGY